MHKSIFNLAQTKDYTKLKNKIKQMHFVTKPSSIQSIISILKWGLIFTEKILTCEIKPIKKDKENRNTIFYISLDEFMNQNKHKNNLVKEYFEIFSKKESIQANINLIRFNSISDKIKFCIFILNETIISILIAFYNVKNKDDTYLIRTKFIVEITSYMIKNILNVSNTNNFYILMTYTLENYLLSAKLLKDGYNTYLCPTPQLENENKQLISKGLKFCYLYQFDEFKKYKKSMNIEEIEYWGPHDTSNLIKYNINHKQNANKIAIYSSGWWIRNRSDFHPSKIYDKEVMNEIKLIKHCNKLTKKMPELQFTLLIHPCEKKNITKTKQFYEKILGPNHNIVISYKNNSSECFDNFGLGLTVGSTIGFDRIECGYRTLFYNPTLINPDPHFKFYSLFCRNESSLVEAIKLWNNKCDKDFQKRFNIIPLKERIEQIKKII